LLGLGVTGRTFVTKADCTPAFPDERCGKSFIFNRKFLGWYVLAGTGGRARIGRAAYFLPGEVTIPGKNCQTVPFRIGSELFF
jgi:hypothetical protein